MSQGLKITGETLKKVQQTELDILKTVARFCDRHKITYFLSSGTLLGAVRHGGFIPWDDDVDISMPRADYEKFLSLADEFPAGFQVVSTRLNPNYPIAITKVRKDGTVMKEPSMAHLAINHGVWIDIFPIDKVADASRLPKRARLFNILNTVINYKLKCASPQKTATKLFCAVLSVLSVKTLDRMRTWVMCCDENKECGMTTSFASNLGSHRLLLDNGVYFPLRKIQFEDEVFSAPANAEKWLTNAYGDYMTLPPEEKQVNRHVVTELIV